MNKGLKRVLNDINGSMAIETVLVMLLLTLPIMFLGAKVINNSTLSISASNNKIEEIKNNEFCKAKVCGVDDATKELIFCDEWSGFYSVSGKTDATATEDYIEGYVPVCIVEGDETVYDVQTTKTYNIKCLGWDNETLSETVYTKYSTPSCPRPSSIPAGYTFEGFSPTYSRVTRDASYTAVFTKNKYTVKFINNDNSIISKNVYEYGDRLIIPDAPTFVGNVDNGTSMYFKGWDKVVSNSTIVTQDVTYMATYSEKIETVTVKFVNYDGTLLQQDVQNYSTKASYRSEPPVKPGNANVNYKFTAWKSNNGSTLDDVIVEDTTFTAQFASSNVNRILSKDLVTYAYTTFSSPKKIEFGYESDLSQIKEKTNNQFVDVTDTSAGGTPNAVLAYREGDTLKVVSDSQIIVPANLSGWFSSTYVSTLSKAEGIKFANLDTHNFSNGSRMFQGFGSEAQSVTISGLEQFDTSTNISDISRMFESTGAKALSLSISGLDNWNVSKVTSLDYLFANTTDYSEPLYESTGYDAYGNEQFRIKIPEVSAWSIGNLSNWNVANVTSMDHTFANAGRYSPSWNVGNISGWNVQKVTNMSNLFSNALEYANNVNLALNSWNVARVTNMESMFKNVCKNASGNCSVGNLSSWNVASVTTMSEMFKNYQFNNTSSFTLGDLKNWNVANVTTMYGMFQNAGASSSSWSVGDISSWNTAKVTNMSYLFANAANSAGTVTIGTFKNWKTSNVVDASNMFNGFNNEGPCTTALNFNLATWNLTKLQNGNLMFANMREKDTKWTLGDLNAWRLNSLKTANSMFFNAGLNATNFSLGNTNNWFANNSVLSDTSYMFAGAGRNTTGTWNIGSLNSWKVNNVTNMESMFNEACRNTSFNIGTLSTWNVANVTNMKNMFKGVGGSMQYFNTLDLKNWNIAKVENFSGMFYNAGYDLYASAHASYWWVGDLESWGSKFKSNAIKTDMFGDTGFAYYSGDPTPRANGTYAGKVHNTLPSWYKL